MSDTLTEHVRATIDLAFADRIPPQVRTIQASWNEVRVHIMCYVDGKIDEDFRTEIGYIGSTVMEDFLPERRTFIELSRLDAPAPIPPPKFADGIMIYERI